MRRGHPRGREDAPESRGTSARQDAREKVLNARDRKQADRERTQNERTKQQDERERGQEQRERGQEQRERGQEQRERGQEQRERAQDEREVLLKEREHLRDLFVSILGHDLRTPLTTIKLTAAGLRKGGTLSMADASAVQRIERAAGRIEVMASELLDFARTRLGGGFQIQRSTVDVVALIAEILEEFRVLYPHRVVRCELPASAEGSFDRSKVAQVISNLLRNAFEYAPAGTPISITLLERPDSISVEVANEGPAIPPALQETMFDPFRRGRSASPHGLGLGLFIAKEIATAHGGAVSFTSTEGETRFLLRLPRA